jgi:hypothetical protein
VSKDGQVARAKRDLAQRLGISEQEITLQSVQETDWPDASLGAPEHGQVYAQMLVFGYIITLSAHGKSYRYHSDDATRVVAV